MNSGKRSHYLPAAHFSRILSSRRFPARLTVLVSLSMDQFEKINFIHLTSARFGSTIASEPEGTGEDRGSSAKATAQALFVRRRGGD
jgi:hypothetical protein